MYLNLDKAVSEAVCLPLQTQKFDVSRNADFIIEVGEQLTHDGQSNQRIQMNRNMKKDENSVFDFPASPIFRTPMLINRCG